MSHGGPEESQESPVRIKTEPINHEDNKDFQRSLKILEATIKKVPGSDNSILKDNKIKQEIQQEPTEIKIEYQRIQQENITETNDNQLSGRQRIRKPRNRNRGGTKKKQIGGPHQFFQPYIPRPQFNPNPWAGCTRNYPNVPCNQNTNKIRMDNQIIAVDSLSNDSDKLYFLRVTNFPVNWSLVEIKSFIGKDFGPVNKIEMSTDEEMKFTGAIKIGFQSIRKCRQVKKELNGKQVQGKILATSMNETDVESDSDSESVLPSAKRKKQWIPTVDIWEQDPEGLYGLQPEYLESLGITPPIHKWVRVENFIGSKPMLRDLMELAGQVLMYSLVNVIDKTKVTMVMYSHPLEAVQAVSMLNKRICAGKELKVVMEVNPDHPCCMPKYMPEVGPGLGRNGKPVYDIVRQYKRFVKGRSTEINKTIFKSLNASSSTSCPNLNKPSTSGSQNSVSQNYIRLNKIRKNNARQNSGRQNNVHHNNISKNNVHHNNISQNNFHHNNISQNNVHKNSDCQNNDRHNSERQNNVRQNLVPQGNVLQSNPPPESLMSIDPHYQPDNIRQNIVHQNLVPRSNPPESLMSVDPYYQPDNLRQNIFHQKHVPQNNIPQSNLPLQPLMSIVPHYRPVSAPLDPKFNQEYPGSASTAVPFIFGQGVQLDQVRRPLSAGFIPIPTVAQKSTTVELSNLPPLTTFVFLSERMSHCGPVMGIQFTAPGTAVVRFVHHDHAIACCQQFNNTSLMDHVVLATMIS